MLAPAAPPVARRRSAAGLLPAPVVLGGVAWDEYVRFRDDPVNDQLRLTYDARTEELEIAVTVGERHESVGRYLLLFVAAYGRVRRLRMKPVGATTWRRIGGGGAEGDESFYVSRFDEAVSRDGNVPDLDGGDAPPDLLIEVDVANPGVDKLPIYERIGIPEVWVWEDETIVVRRLARDGYGDRGPQRGAARVPAANRGGADRRPDRVGDVRVGGGVPRPAPGRRLSAPLPEVGRRLLD